MLKLPKRHAALDGERLRRRFENLAVLLDRQPDIRLEWPTALRAGRRARTRHNWQSGPPIGTGIPRAWPRPLRDPRMPPPRRRGGRTSAERSAGSKSFRIPTNPVNKTLAEERFKKVSSAYDILATPRSAVPSIAARSTRWESRVAVFIAHRPGPTRGRRVQPTAAPSIPDWAMSSPTFSDPRAPPAQRCVRRAVRMCAIRSRSSILEAVTGARKRVSMPEGGILDLNVPQGVADGQVLRLKGKGAAGFRGGEPGDALVEIKVRAHAQFKRALATTSCSICPSPSTRRC